MLLDSASNDNPNHQHQHHVHCLHVHDDGHQFNEKALGESCKVVCPMLWMPSARARASAVVTGYCVPTCWALVNPAMPIWLSKPLSIKSICVKRKNVLVTGRGAQARLKGDLSRRDECELRSGKVKLNEGNSIVWTVCQVQYSCRWYTMTMTPRPRT